jgi:SdrD B-like protein
MSQEVGQNELQAKTRQLMDGPLKHIKAAVLAAALVPLASVLATPASAQTSCQSAGICGFVWNDTNGDGIQDAGETGIEGAKVCLNDCSTFTYTDTEGIYFFPVGPGTYTVIVMSGDAVQGKKPSPYNVGSNDSVDSDGLPDVAGNSVATGVVVIDENHDTDFGFTTSTAKNPGTGTPGYWKNHPEAWPASVTQNGITVGGVAYSKDDAIIWLGKVGKDKTTTMFSSLVSAKLNLLIGNQASCVSGAISLADAWMAKYGPVGSNVAASSAAWTVGEPLHQTMDAYNNGLLCAPHRQ